MALPTDSRAMLKVLVWRSVLATCLIGLGLYGMLLAIVNYSSDSGWYQIGWLGGVSTFAGFGIFVDKCFKLYGCWLEENGECIMEKRQG
jgi:hypothetical protein